MTRKQKRLSVIAGALAFLGAATALTFYALGQKASFFYMPAELQAATLGSASASGWAAWSKRARSCVARAQRSPSL